VTLPAPIPATYPELLDRLKDEIRSARTRAVLAVNVEQTGLYWRIGREILDRQDQEGWGAKVIDRLADDLRAAAACGALGFGACRLTACKRSGWASG